MVYSGCGPARGESPNRSYRFAGICPASAAVRCACRSFAREDKCSAREIAKVVATPAFQKKAEEQGPTADYQTPAQLDEKVRRKSIAWSEVVKAAKVEAD